MLVNPQMAEQGWQPRVEYSLDELNDEAAVRALVNRSPEVRWTAYVLGVVLLAASATVPSRSTRA